MAGTIKIDYPQYLADSMKLDSEEFSREMKITALVKLFELGKVSSGMAAKVLNISRIEFLELLAGYKVSSLDTGRVQEDFKNA